MPNRTSVQSPMHVGALVRMWRKIDGTQNSLPSDHHCISYKVYVVTQCVESLERLSRRHSRRAKRALWKRACLRQANIERFRSCDVRRHLSGYCDPGAV